MGKIKSVDKVKQRKRKREKGRGSFIIIAYTRIIWPAYPGGLTKRLLRAYVYTSLS